MRKLIVIAAVPILVCVLVFPVGADQYRRGATLVISRYPSGEPAPAGQALISDDGSRIGFVTTAALVSEDTDVLRDFYIYERSSGSTRLISKGSEFASGEYPYALALSGDGSVAAMLVGFQVPRLVVLEIDTGTVIFSGVPSSLGVPWTLSISSNGSSVGYTTWNADFEDYRHYVFDLEDHRLLDLWYYGSVRCVPHPGGGSDGGESCADVYPLSAPDLSADGRFVVFSNNGDPCCIERPLKYDVFRLDRDTDADGIYDETGAIRLDQISTRSDGSMTQADSGEPSISDDGQLVAFSSRDSLVVIDQFSDVDIYLRNMTTGALSLLSTSSNGVPSITGGSSRRPYISSGGGFVSFSSSADLLARGDLNPTGPDGEGEDVFVKDLLTGEVAMASPDPPPDSISRRIWRSSVSNDGRYVSFVYLSGFLTLPLPPSVPALDKRSYVDAPAYLRDRTVPCSSDCLFE